jgi:tetratricopeptide (TPR) repeat protein
MEHLNLPIFHLGYIEGMVRKKDERNRDLILQNYRDNPQVPLNIYNYTTVRWKEDPKILEKLENAFENANHALRYAVAERALAWLDEFKKDCLPDEENLWEERLSAQDPNAALLHLRRARSAFLKQDLNSSIESYRRVFSRIIFEDLHPEVAREVLDRLGVLEAMQGNFAKALEMVTELESRFGRNPGSFYLTLKLLFASSEFDLLLEQAQNLPEDLSSLPLPKLQEILSFLEKLPITQKKSVLMRFQEAAFSKK